MIPQDARTACLHGRCRCPSALQLLLERPNALGIAGGGLRGLLGLCGALLCRGCPALCLLQVRLQLVHLQGIRLSGHVNDAALAFAQGLWLDRGVW